MIGTNRIMLTHTAVSVATTNTAVLSANDNRNMLILINDSDTVMYVYFGGTAAVNTGIRLNANGGTLYMDVNSVDCRAITAIHGGTGSKVLLVSYDR